MTRAVVPLIAFLTGCACYQPSDAPNYKDKVWHRWVATVQAYQEAGHEFQAADWDSLYVEVVHAHRFRCGWSERAAGCYSHLRGHCPYIRIALYTLETSVVEHEFLHYITAQHGYSSGNHDKDMPDFYKIVEAAFRKTHPYDELLLPPPR